MWPFATFSNGIFLNSPQLRLRNTTADIFGGRGDIRQPPVHHDWQDNLNGVPYSEKHSTAAKFELNARFDAGKSVQAPSLSCEYEDKIIERCPVQLQWDQLV